MNAVRFYKPNVIKYESVDIPELKEGEILVKVHAALTCGTDVKTFKRGHPVLIKKVPSGFGHEFAGEVVKVDKAVKNFKIKDRVVASNSAPCGECFFCKKGQFELCENLDLLNGAYAEYIVIPKRIVEKNTIILPDDLPYEKAAFCEPLSNVIHGIEKTPIQKGDTVVVAGVGPIGLMFAKLAKLKGAKVISLGRNPLKLQAALDFSGVDKIIDISNNANFEDEIFDLTQNRGVDVAIECVGIPDMWEKMFNIVRKGGCVHFFGGCAKGTKVSLLTQRIHYDEVKIISSFHHTPDCFRKALSMISQNQIDVTKLITKTLPMKDAKQAILEHKDGKAIKILLKN